MSLNIEIFKALKDNYFFILECTETNEIAIVDPTRPKPALKALENRKLSKILNTHHHHDHIGGNAELVKKYNCEVYAHESDAHRTPCITHKLNEGDTINVGKQKAEVLFVPGHTNGHIAYYFKDSNTIFVGDTLFAGGCGRLFEGTALQMLNSLAKLKQLPPETKVYCAHEYTKSNLTFSLNYSENKENYAKRLEQVKEVRSQNLPTIPTTIGEELKSNIFLRCKTLEEFTKVRKAKDQN